MSIGEKLICSQTNCYEDGSSSITAGREYEIIYVYEDSKGVRHFVIIDDTVRANHFEEAAIPIFFGDHE